MSLASSVVKLWGKDKKMIYFVGLVALIAEGYS